MNWTYDEFEEGMKGLIKLWRSMLESKVGETVTITSDDGSRKLKFERIE